MRLTHEVRWILTGQSPEQIPMARLAEYMKQLAILFGEQDRVHFARVEKSSTAVVANIDPGVSSHKVQRRLYRVREGRAPGDAQRAFEHINGMVADDDGNARLKFGSATILRFPGRRPQAAEKVVVHDHGTITGKLYAMAEGTGGTVNARIRPRLGTNYIPCTVESDIAKELRNFLLEAVRVQGKGRWVRTEAGEWTCESFHITQAGAVRETTLREAINELRAIDVDWPDDPLGDWARFDEQDEAV